MQRMIIADGLTSDAATVTGSASSGSLVIDNLKKMSLKKVYRALGDTIFIQTDLGAAKPINTFALMGHSGSSRSNIRIRGATSVPNLTAAPGYDSGILPFRSHQSGYDATWALTVPDEEQYSWPDKNLFFLFLTAAQTFRYWRYDIVDTGKTYIDIGRHYMDKAWQASVNMSYGFGEGLVDPSSKYRMKSGEVVSVERRKYKSTSFSLDYLTKEEMFANLYPLELKQGRTRDLLFIPDPDEKDFLQYKSYYGTMEALQPVINPSFELYRKSFTFEEIPS